MGRGCYVTAMEFGASTSTGTVNYRDPAITQTPKAVWFMHTLTATDDSTAAHRVMGFGAAIGSQLSSWAYNLADEDAQGTIDCSNRHTTSVNVSLARGVQLYSGNGTGDGGASFESFLAPSGADGGGFQLNWRVAASIATIVVALVFWGDGIQAHADVADLGNTANLDTSITTPGFTPDLILVSGGANQGGDGISDVAHYTDWFGFANRGTGSAVDTQVGTSFTVENNTGTSLCVSEIVDTALFQAYNPTSQVRTYLLTVQSFDTNGFTVRTSGAAGGVQDIRYLALKLDGVPTYVGTGTVPQTTGVETITAPGFKPQLLLGSFTMHDALNTRRVAALSGSGCYGIAANDGSYERGLAHASEDGVGTSNTGHRMSTSMVWCSGEDITAGADYIIDTPTFNNNGWTWNVSDAASSTRKYAILAVGAQRRVFIT